MKRFQAEGKDESEAVDLAIAEMGDPVATATEIGLTLPPNSPAWLKVIRFLAAGGLIYFTLLFLNFAYQNQYGRDFRYFFVTGAFLAFFLIPILLLWPTIIWRKNWLFGVAPAGFATLAVMVMMTLGTSQDAYVDMERGDRYVAPAIPPEIPGREIDRENIALRHSRESNGISLVLNYAAVILMISAAVYLISFVQRSSQRRWVIGFCLITLAGFHLIYEFEEAKFKKEMFHKLEQREKELENGVPPEEAEFVFYWKSDLIPHYNLNYTSSRNYVWIMD